MALPPNAETSGLPQYGFGSDVDFGTLINSNHFLFRVYTPRAPFHMNDPYFIAPKFDAKYNSPLEDSLWQKAFDIDPPDLPIGTYADIARHMDWTTRLSSPFISTSFSFIWSIWEALRRYHSGIKKDVEIAVIDARAVADRSVTAIQLLRDSLPSERREEHWKWYRFCQESQSALVHGFIPARAVLASIPLIPLLERLPSYFLQPPIPNVPKINTLSTIGWDYTEKKRSFRVFCQAMSNRFLQLSPEVRLQDTTTGSVRLAMSFLRPWFHGYVVEDFDRAVDALCSLAYSIAQWPGQWWTQEHSEIQDLIRAIVVSIGEEVIESHRGRRSFEAALTRIITEREPSETSSIDVLLEDSMIMEPPANPTLPLPPINIPAPIVQPTKIQPSPSPLVLAPPMSISRSHSHEVRTPITPPDSPVRFSKRPPPRNRSDSIVPSFPRGIPIPLLDRNPHTPPPSPTPNYTSSPHLSMASLPSTEEELAASSSQTPSLQPINLPSVSPRVLITEHSPLDVFHLEHQKPEHEAGTTLFDAKEHPLAEDTPKERRKTPKGSSYMAETASCLVTGFLVGAFITLCILAPQRRTLLHLT